MPRMPPVPGEIRAALEQLCGAQHQVTTRSQLATIGLSRHHVAAQLEARRWQALGPLVIVLHNGPLTTRQCWWAAVLSAEGPAGLAARTAAEDAGLLGWETD